MFCMYFQARNFYFVIFTTRSLLFSTEMCIHSNATMIRHFLFLWLNIRICFFFLFDCAMQVQYQNDLKHRKCTETLKVCSGQMRQEIQPWPCFDSCNCVVESKYSVSVKRKYTTAHYAWRG